MAHEELKVLAVYAMFGVSTMNDANLERAAQRKLSLSSKPRFGVFVTLRRHENVFNVDRLDPSSFRLAGCMATSRVSEVCCSCLFTIISW